MNPVLLGVNVDHVATLRQSRLTRYPNPVQAALIAEQAGADSITIHLREDRRHIQERDVHMMRDLLLTPMNLEMAVTEEMLAIAENIKPQFCCLVPERREELTTEGGLDVCGQIPRIKDACQRLAEAGIRVSLFIDAEPEQIVAAKEVGAPVIELHTGQYADSENMTDNNKHLDRIIRGAQQGTDAGLQVNAGHGLNYQNVKPIAEIPHIHELNIGHAIIARALFTGLARAVMDMKRLINEARH